MESEAPVEMSKGLLENLFTRRQVHLPFQTVSVDLSIEVLTGTLPLLPKSCNSCTAAGVISCHLCINNSRSTPTFCNEQCY